MLVILKIPVVYLCAVVWWAVRAEPPPLEGAGRPAELVPVVPRTPGSCDWRPRRTLDRRTVRRRPPIRPRPGRLAA